MGQKVDPRGLRLGVNKDWQSKWYAEGSEYVKSLNNDIKIREFLTEELKDAAVAEIIIERKNNRIDVKISTAKPGVIIGRGGEDIEKLRANIKKVCGEDVFVTINEIKNPALSAELVAQNIAKQIENRAPFRSAQKKAIKETMKAGAKGIKTAVSGRLGGAEMARTEGYTEGTVPLQTIRADVDYAVAEASTTYGKIGVKVWIYKGEILNKKASAKEGGNDDVNAKKN
ncbi:MAG: 30S ribosomal protein S3 [Erysipelotrichales bacterium]|nr:30S ribosomal protein S3 [Erysipelotrichales bacterium]